MKKILASNHQVRLFAYYAGLSAVKRSLRGVLNKRPTLFILMYHKVEPSAYPYFGASVVPEVFERQIKALSKHYKMLALEELTNPENYECTKDIIALTFDDGYQSIYRWAFPILKKYNVPSTVFLVTNYTNTDKLLWHDYLAWILYACKNEIKKHLSFIPDLPRKLLNCIEDFFASGQNNNLRIKSLREIALRLRRFSEEDRHQIFDMLINFLEVEVPAKFSRAILSWEEIREMSEHNVYFGAHTQTHPVLSRLLAEDVTNEIVGSKNEIENKIQKAVTTFAFPYGKEEDYTEENINQIKRCGFKLACTAIRGEESFPLKNPFALKRRPVENTPYLFY